MADESTTADGLIAELVEAAAELAPADAALFAEEARDEIEMGAGRTLLHVEF